MDSPPNDKWGFVLLKGWFVGCASCTLQTLYAWQMRGLGIGMVGILIYRVLCLSLGCDSWHASYAIKSSKIIQSACIYYSPFIIHTIYAIQLSQCSSDNLVA